MFPRLSPDYRFSDILKTVLPAKTDAVKLLQMKFLSITGHKHALAFRYGRSGLYFLLKALDKKKAKYVVLPSYNCVVMAHSIIKAGYKPIFLDSHKGSFQPSFNDFIDTINRYGNEIAMIIPTHLFGITEETKLLYEYFKKSHPSVFVLQDCAHGFFCKGTDECLAIEYSDGALFGMNISKLVNSVKGGMLTVNNTALATKIENLHKAESRQNYQIMQSILARLYVIATYFAFKPYLYNLTFWLQKNTTILSAQTDYYKEDAISLPPDYSGRMCNFEATIGLSSLNRYYGRIAVRQKIAARYKQILSDELYKKNFTHPEFKNGNTWSHYPVLCANPYLKEHLKSILKDRGFEIGEIVDYSIADMNCYKQLGYSSTPRAKNIAELIINFPLTLYENNDGTTLLKHSKNIDKFENAFKFAMKEYFLAINVSNKTG